MRLNIIRDDLKRCEIKSEICIEQFTAWKSLPKQKGCYSIWQGDVCIYVGKAGGKGGFPDRSSIMMLKLLPKIEVEPVILLVGFIIVKK